MQDRSEMEELRWDTNEPNGMGRVLGEIPNPWRFLHRRRRKAWNISYPSIGAMLWPIYSAQSDYGVFRDSFTYSQSHSLLRLLICSSAHDSVMGESVLRTFPLTCGM